MSKRVRTVVQEKIPKVKFEGLAQFHGHFPQQLLKISFQATVNHGTYLLELVLLRQSVECELELPLNMSKAA